MYAPRSWARDGALRHQFEAQNHALPSQLFECSKHDYDLADRIERVRALGKLPPHLIVYGIEGGAFGHGMGLYKEVASAAHDVIHLEIR